MEIIFIFIFFIISGFTIYNFIKSYSVKESGTISPELESKVEKNTHRILTLEESDNSTKTRLDNIDEDFYIFKTNITSTVTSIQNLTKKIEEKELPVIKEDINVLKNKIENNPSFIESKNVLIVNDVYSLIKKNLYYLTEMNYMFEDINNYIKDGTIDIFCIGQVEIQTDLDLSKGKISEEKISFIDFLIIFIPKIKKTKTYICDVIFFKNPPVLYKQLIIKKINDVIISGLSFSIDENNSLILYFFSYVYDNVLDDKILSVTNDTFKEYISTQTSIFPIKTKKKIIAFSIGRAPTWIEKISLPNSLNNNILNYFTFSDLPSLYFGNVPAISVEDKYDSLQEKKDSRFYGCVKIKLNIF